MNNNELKAELLLQRKTLDTFFLRLGKLRLDMDNLEKGALTSEHTALVMKDCLTLLSDDNLGAKLKPVINAIHKACFKNARLASAEEQRARDKELMDLMPACYRSKNKGKKGDTGDKPFEETDTTELARLYAV